MHSFPGLIFFYQWNIWVRHQFGSWNVLSRKKTLVFLAPRIFLFQDTFEHTRFTNRFEHSSKMLCKNQTTSGYDLALNKKIQINQPMAITQSHSGVRSVSLSKKSQAIKVKSNK